MATNTIDAGLLAKMFLAGAKNLEVKKEWINELNVFPVPDGDTGTNMTLTIMSAVKEVNSLTEVNMYNLSKAISSGSLRGARGNSGVILSQLLRGFTKKIRDYEELNAEILAEAMGKALDAILAPVAERGIPFAAVFGNHDDEGGVSKETQLAIYQSYPGCLMSAGPDDITGCGNYNLLVWSSDGSRPVCNLWFLDSGTYGEKGVSKYARVEQDQIDWYTSTAAALEEQYGEMLPAYLFQHIIVPEIYDLLTEVPASEKKAEGVVKGFSSHSGHYYKMGDGFTAGHLGEAPCPPDIPSGEFAAMRDTGDVVAAFFGHDHKNDFVGTYEGIDLVNTAGTGFYIYGEREYHGARLVILHESTPAEYDTEMLYYKDLVSEPLPGGLTSIHGKYVENIVMAAAVGLLVLIGAGVLVGVRIAKRKKRSQK